MVLILYLEVIFFRCMIPGKEICDHIVWPRNVYQCESISLNVQLPSNDFRGSTVPDVCQVLVISVKHEVDIAQQMYFASAVREEQLWAIVDCLLNRSERC